MIVRKVSIASSAKCREKQTNHRVEVGRGEVLKVSGVAKRQRMLVSVLFESKEGKVDETHAIFLGAQTPLYSGLSMRGANHLPL